MGKPHLYWVALLAAGVGCYRADPCLADAQLHRRSPSGDREVTVYPGGCPGVFLAPQVTVGFRRAGSGGGVFALGDSAGPIDARWVSEDTLEVSYPAGARVVKRDSVARFREERVYVVYRTQGARSRAPKPCCPTSRCS
jgi:hypothetical protein